MAPEVDKKGQGDTPENRVERRTMSFAERMLKRIERAEIRYPSLKGELLACGWAEISDVAIPLVRVPDQSLGLNEYYLLYLDDKGVWTYPLSIDKKNKSAKVGLEKNHLVNLPIKTSFVPEGYGTPFLPRLVIAPVLHNNSEDIAQAVARAIQGVDTTAKSIFLGKLLQKLFADYYGGLSHEVAETEDQRESKIQQILLQSINVIVSQTDGNHPDLKFLSPYGMILEPAQDKQSPDVAYPVIRDDMDDLYVLAPGGRVYPLKNISTDFAHVNWGGQGAQYAKPGLEQVETVVKTTENVLVQFGTEKGRLLGVDTSRREGGTAFAGIASKRLLLALRSAFTQYSRMILDE